VERIKPDLIMVVCENDECKEPMFISLIQEACLKYFSAMVCHRCGHRHTDLAELREFSKKTRNYEND